MSFPPRPTFKPVHLQPLMPFPTYLLIFRLLHQHIAHSQCCLILDIRHCISSSIIGDDTDRFMQQTMSISNKAYSKNHKAGVEPKNGGSGHNVFRPFNWTVIPVIAFNWQSKVVLMTLFLCKKQASWGANNKDCIQYTIFLPNHAKPLSLLSIS